MNKIIAAFATLLVTTAVVAAPGGRGGHGGGHRGAPARQVQRASAPRPAARASRPAVQHSRPAVQHARPAPHRPAVQHARPASHRPHGGFRPAPRPYHHRHWARPPMPPVRPLALYGWTWIATPWTILVDGVYCSGDGYWFDGYNYYYNDCYYTSAPVSVSVNLSF